MKKLLLLLIPVVLIGGYLLLNKGTAAEVPSEVQTSIVESQSIESLIYVNGKIVTESVRNIKPTSNAIVEKIHVKVGDKVKKDQLLAEMNKDDLNNQLLAKKIQLEIEEVKLSKLEQGSDLELNNAYKQAKSSLNSAQKKMDDDKALLSSGAISKSQYDASLVAYESAKVAYENASYRMNHSSRANDLFIQKKNIESMKNDIKILEDKIEKTFVKSPIDGVVTEIPATEGEGITSKLMVISDFDKNVIKANISEADINKVAIGQRVRITANSSKGNQYDGKVIFIAPGSKTIEGKKASLCRNQGCFR